MEKQKILALIEDYIKVTDLEQLILELNLSGELTKKDILENIKKSASYKYFVHIAETHLNEITRKYWYFIDEKILEEERQRDIKLAEAKVRAELKNKSFFELLFY